MGDRVEREPERNGGGLADPDARWWTTADIAAWLGRSQKAICRAFERGELPVPDRSAGRRRPHRWRPATILAWEEHRRIARLRWPMKPLLDSVGCTVDDLAQAVGVTPSLVYYLFSSGLPDRLADEWAICLGRHPVEVWGWEWVAAAEPSRREPRRPRRRRGRGEVA